MGRSFFSQSGGVSIGRADGIQRNYIPADLAFYEFPKLFHIGLSENQP
jgi:hypothetical protein